MTFKQWMAKVDGEISRQVGITSADLADACYRDMYDDDMNPIDAAHEVLINDGLYGSFISEFGFKD